MYKHDWIKKSTKSMKEPVEKSFVDHMLNA